MIASILRDLLDDAVAYASVSHRILFIAAGFLLVHVAIRTAQAILRDSSCGSQGDDEPDKVKSPTRTYRIAEHFAVGDLCDVYSAVSQRIRFVVKIPRVRSCDRLLLKEHTVLRELHTAAGDGPYAKYFPTPVESFCAGDHLVSVFGWQAGLHPSHQIKLRYSRGIDSRHVAWMFNRTLEALGFVHQCGWVHGAVLPPHLLFHPRNHGLQLIGWTHAVELDSQLRIVPEVWKAWYPTECVDREPATSATDIFLAIKSMIWLAGGDGVTGQLPDQMPLEMQSFLSDCLHRRPGDAWELRDRFRCLLEEIYGPPEFCHLTLS